MTDTPRHWTEEVLTSGTNDAQAIAAAAAAEKAAQKVGLGPTANSKLPATGFPVRAQPRRGAGRKEYECYWGIGRPSVCALASATSTDGSDAA